MRKPRAIVCDDSELIRDVFMYALEMMGYEVLTSDTPVTCAFYREHADSCLRHNRCTDILITDHDIPDMTGLELLEAQHHGGCKLTSRNKALMTGNEDSILRSKALALGCHFFPKPLSVATLAAWVRECESRFNLSESLASELFLPGRGKPVNVIQRL